ncbi:MAG TPA: IS1595 family transposase [Planctomycetota bacterium]|nr:IS1595 family transposase [Planctomycetota bacterium]
MLRDATTDEAKAVEFFESRRWPDAPACPRCGSMAVHKIVGKDGRREAHFRWRCPDCAKAGKPCQYSVRTGTVFEESRLPMRIWAHAYWRACASKKGVSALQIQRETGIGYRAALFMMNRIRFAMDDGAEAPKLSGTVEADEAYVGGKPRRRNNQQTSKHPGNTRAPVLAVVQRGGGVRVRAVTEVTSSNLQRFLFENVTPESRLMTDEARMYRYAGRMFKGGHETVDHHLYEYARGDVTTNTIEGFFSLLKRKVYGTHHAISREHLHRYVAEAAYLYNTRKLTDADRVACAVKASEGKRLRYSDSPSEAA